MGIGSKTKEIEDVLDVYRNRLDIIPDELFNVIPPGGGWSYAEVYSHVLQADIGSTIAIEKCTLKSCVPTYKGRSVIGMFVLSFGRFPPVKVKVPKALDEKIPAKNITKEEARNLLVKCRKRLDNVTPLIHGAPKHNRVKHPRMGMLNAKQWLKFILIHSKHHLKQLDRIEKNFVSHETFYI